MNYAKLYEILTYAAASLAAIPGFFVPHYLGHRFMHKRWVRSIYKAHVLDHHRMYSGDRLESDRYERVKNRTLADLLVGLPTLALLWLMLPRGLFVMVTAECLAIGYFLTALHETFHMRNHPLNRYALYARWKALHEEHHHNQRVNFGFGVHFVDRIFGTFKDVK